MPWWVKAPPSTEPVTLQEVKSHLRVDTTDEDVYIASLITAAREKLEDYMCRAIMQQTLVYVRNAWPQGNEITLPGGQLLSLVSVTYKDINGVLHEFEDVVADTESVPGCIVLAYEKSWPSDTLHPVNPVRIEYTAGYGDTPSAVPQKVKQALLLLIGDLYEHREESTSERLQQIAFGVTALVERERVYWHESR